MSDIRSTIQRFLAIEYGVTEDEIDIVGDAYSRVIAIVSGNIVVGTEFTPTGVARREFEDVLAADRWLIPDEFICPLCGVSDTGEAVMVAHMAEHDEETGEGC